VISGVKGYIQNIYNNFSALSNSDKAKVIAKTVFVATSVGLICGLYYSGFTSAGLGLQAGGQVFKLLVDSLTAKRNREIQEMLQQDAMDQIQQGLINSNNPAIVSMAANIFF